MAKKKRRQSPSEPRDGGTPETRAKLTPGTIEKHIQKGALGREHISAADEIDLCFKYASGAVYTGNIMRERVDGSRGMADNELAALMYKLHFQPWADDLSARRAKGGPPIFGVTIDVVVEGLTSRHCDRKYRKRNGSCVNYLIEGLDLYAK